APAIPTTYRASFNSWLHGATRDTAAAELHLYARASPYFAGATLGNAPNAPLARAFAIASSPDGAPEDIDPPGPRLVHMLEIGTPEESAAEEKVVMLHGYGAGTGFFFQNISALGARPNSRLYALDWLGMGRSARVPFSIPASAAKTTEGRVKAAESFFVEALEDWRRTMGVEKMTLVGHSLGGYLSIAYSLAHPDRVSRLVLVSPVGIPCAPEERPEESPFDASKRRRTDSQSGGPGDAMHIAVLTLERCAGSVFGWLWEQNISPFSLLRNSLFFGPMLAGRYTSRRFGLLDDENLRSLHAYTQGIFMSKASSEHCLAHILAPGAYARMPMVERMAPLRMPVSFIYGATGIDWMDIEGGKEAVRRLVAAGNRATSCFAVPHAGHHVYLDNPK
ncbi:alpha/beta-hydrolase, partial [Tilletiopsis washingtonensis]